MWNLKNKVFLSNYPLDTFCQMVNKANLKQQQNKLNARSRPDYNQWLQMGPQ